MTTSIINFYNNNESVILHSGSFTLLDILSQSDVWLEQQHDYIQLLFPLPEISIHNRSAPLLTKEECFILFSSPKFKSQMMLSFIRMLRFYKLDIEKGNVEKSVDFNVNSFCYVNTHNHLRMTRIMRCMYLCGLSYWSKSLYDVLLEIQNEYGIFSDLSLKHFAAAIKGEYFEQHNTIIATSL